MYKCKDFEIHSIPFHRDGKITTKTVALILGKEITKKVYDRVCFAMFSSVKTFYIELLYVEKSYQKITFNQSFYIVQNFNGLRTIDAINKSTFVSEVFELPDELLLDNYTSYVTSVDENTEVIFQENFDLSGNQYAEFINLNQE